MRFTVEYRRLKGQVKERRYSTEIVAGEFNSEETHGALQWRGGVGLGKFSGSRSPIGRE
jgi:hypothetical protein